MNHLRMKNNIAVSSRDWSDDSWRLCPELASWVNATREPQPDVSRRLHGEVLLPLQLLCPVYVKLYTSPWALVDAFCTLLLCVAAY